MITGTGGMVSVLSSPPASVQVHALVSTTNIQGFFESETTLSSNQPVDTDTAGFVNNVSQLVPTSISSGTCVDSYLFEWDPGGLPPPNTAQADGFIKFDQPIVGVEVLDASLDGSDGLGSSSTSYPTGMPSVERGFELVGGTHTNRSGNPDTFTLNASLTKLTVHMDTGAFFDQVRILVGCGQGAMLPDAKYAVVFPVIGLASVAVYYARRRRTPRPITG